MNAEDRERKKRPQSEQEASSSPAGGAKKGAKGGQRKASGDEPKSSSPESAASRVAAAKQKAAELRKKGKPNTSSGEAQSAPKSSKAKKAPEKPEKAQKPAPSAKTGRQKPAPASDAPAEQKTETQAKEKPKQKTKPASKPKSSRPTPTRTIPAHAYRRIKQVLHERNIWQLAGFVLMSSMLFTGLIWYWQVQSIEGRIVQLSIDGWKALEEASQQEQNPVSGNGAELREQAYSAFDEALDLYQNHFSAEYSWLWQSSIRVTPAMIKVAQGFQAVRDPAKAVTAYREISYRIRETNKSMWRTLETATLQLINAAYWEPEEYDRLYQEFIAEDPEDWGLGELHLVRLCEEMSQVRYPMYQRVDACDRIYYGTPRYLSSARDSRMVIDAKIIYKTELPSGAHQIDISPALSEAARERVVWYSRQESPCLIFVQMVEDNPTLTRIELIALSEPLNVEPFNQAIQGGEPVEISAQDAEDEANGGSETQPPPGE